MSSLEGAFPFSRPQLRESAPTPRPPSIDDRMPPMRIGGRDDMNHAVGRRRYIHLIHTRHTHDTPGVVRLCAVPRLAARDTTSRVVGR